MAASPASAAASALVREGAIAAPPLTVLVSRWWTELTLPEWAALAAIIYTVLITARLIVFTLEDFGWVTLPRRRRKHRSNDDVEIDSKP